MSEYNTTAADRSNRITALIIARINKIDHTEQARVKRQLRDLQKQQIDESHPLFEKTIVMTGFRDTDIQEALKNVGAKLGSSVSKNTFVVLVKDLSEDTGKAADARRLGIHLMTPEVFKEKYL